MSDPETNRVPGAGRGIKIALAVSLALNLLIVGLVAGAFLGAGKDGGSNRSELRALGLGPFALALSRDDRAEVRDRMAMDAQGRDRAVIGAALRELQSILRAEPFDRNAAAAALRRTRVAAEALQGRGHSALLDQIESMSVGDRQVLADRLDRALRRVGPRRPPRTP